LEIKGVRVSNAKIFAARLARLAVTRPLRGRKNLPRLAAPDLPTYLIGVASRYLDSPEDLMAALKDAGFVDE